MLVKVRNAQVKEYNKGSAWLQFPTPIGCSFQIQSFDKNIGKDDLDKIVSILINVGSADRGLMNEFPLSFPFFPDLQKDSLFLVSKKKVESFDTIISRLEKYQPPLFFISALEKLLANYKLRQEYNRVTLTYLATHDEKSFRENVFKFNKDSAIVAWFDTLENSKTFYEKMNYVPSKIYNEVNRKVFPLEPIQKLQEELLKKNNIRIVYEECED